MADPQKIRPVMLVILDGWGWREDPADNAVRLAKTPNFDRLWTSCPHALLRTSGLNVGLPDGQMGNSEVGHLNIGAGRVVMQDLPRIGLAIEDGSLAKNPVLTDLIGRLKATGGTCHLTLPAGLDHFDLDTPLADILPLGECTIDGVPKFDTTDKAAVSNAAKLTARMVLSHQTGLAHHDAVTFQFQSGQGHGYSNIGILYLQQVIEKLTKANLEVLAKKQVFEPLHMDDSSFVADKSKPVEARATHSLQTTPSDYARFASAWMHEKDCSLVKMSETPTLENQKASARSRFILTERGFFYYNKSNGTLQTLALDPLGAQLANLHRRFAEVAEDKPIDVLSNAQLMQIKSITGHTHLLQEAFIPQVFMTEDKGKEGRIGVAKGMIPDADLSHVAWGLGWGLQTADDGHVTTAYHTGDMNKSRAWVAMNLEDKTATVFFANSHNGHILAEQIMPKTTQLEHAANYFFQKWGFARDVAQLGGRLDNWGLRSDDVVVAAPALEVDDIVPTALEAPTLNVTQQYRKDLGNITHRAEVEPPKEEAVVVAHSSPSPFKMTPTPKPPGGDVK